MRPLTHVDRRAECAHPIIQQPPEEEPSDPKYLLTDGTSYKCRLHRSIRTWAPPSVLNTSPVSSSSRSLPLKDSTYPFPRARLLNEGRPRPDALDPALRRLGHELRPLVRADVPRRPAGDEQCTGAAQEPLQVIRRFVQRWQVEVTFRGLRDHLGVEIRRQRPDRAIARTTSCLLAPFSTVALLAARLGRHARLRVSTAAWHHKKRPTFPDTLAAVRRQVWAEQGLLTSRHSAGTAKLRPALREGIAHALCHAA